MSFKIFSLQLFGKIKDVETIENQRKKLADDFEQFKQIEKSEELKAFLELQDWVNSEAFKKKKAEIESLTFKGSKEYNQIKELKSLQKSTKIKRYFKIEGSSDLKRYEKLTDSEKLNEYYALLEYIKEGQFKKEKQEIKSQIFKGSVEEKHWLDFKKLRKLAGIKAYNELNGSEVLKKHELFAGSEKLKEFVALRNAPEKDKQKQKACKALKRDPEIKAYFKFEKSKKLKLYHETSNSRELAQYYELKTYVESDEFKKREAFLNDKKKFEKSEAFKKQQRFKELAADNDVRFVLKFGKSALYKNYLDVKNSFDLKRYFELTEITKTDEFLKRKAYLEDKKRWEKTEEFKKQQEWIKQKTEPQFVLYFKYKGTTDFDVLKNRELVFEDNFSASELDKAKWSNINFLSEKLLGDSYSMPGDLQVFANGKNCKTGGQLTILVKKERAEGKVWQMPAGFVPAVFDYTSDLVSNSKSCQLEEGIFEAKIKFNPVKQVVSSFYLSGEKNTPRINLLEMGTKNHLGISTLGENGKVHLSGIDISNLKPNRWYIFTVEKTGNSIVWKINETEVFSIQNTTLNFPLHINAATLVVYDIDNSKLPVNFEIAWVKCYRRK